MEFGEYVMQTVSKALRTMTVSDKARLELSDDYFWECMVDFGEVYDRSIRDMIVQIAKDAVETVEVDYTDNYYAACKANLP